MESGLLNINKPGGVTSFWVVQKVKRILETKKAGHCGTLDPMAVGVLLVLFGAATKKQAVLMESRKVYTTRLLLGVTTDTADITGKVIDRKAVPDISVQTVDRMLNRFIGTIKQFTPVYSAYKYKGKRLYEYARAGEKALGIPRIVTVYSLECLGVGEKTIDLRIECSGGTYIRSLGQDIGNALGCGACLKYLCRDRIGDFDISSAIDGKKLDSYTKEDLIGLSIRVPSPRS